MNELEQALLDPTAVYAAPEEVLRDGKLTREQKIEVLKRWEYDARELEVAEEENMTGGVRADLAQVLRALAQLGAGTDTAHSPTTKQGGV